MDTQPLLVALCEGRCRPVQSVCCKHWKPTAQAGWRLAQACVSTGPGTGAWCYLLPPPVLLGEWVGGSCTYGGDA